MDPWRDLGPRGVLPQHKDCGDWDDLGPRGLIAEPIVGDEILHEPAELPEPKRQRGFVMV